DSLLELVNEKFKTHEIHLTEPIDKIVNYYITLTETLEKTLTLDEGFVFTEPFNPWSLQQEFLSIIRDSKNTLRLCTPYPDASTFSFLTTVSSNVQIKMIIQSDREELKKRKKLSIEALEKTISGKRVEIRRNPEIHIRFIVGDDKIVMFSSADLREDQLKKKYQYGFWTNNEHIVQRVVEYFENLWNSSKTINLFEELKPDE
ncbi:MAG: phospholipase D-like domain-containing protein, partial [Candidatus Freyarchaeota archaeon]